MSRILGIDFGDRRIGVAVSDPLHIIATAHRVVEYDDIHVAKKQIRDIVVAQEAGSIVVGLPLNMDGSEGPAVEKVRAFIDLLTPLVNVPITLWDERLTTKSAHDALIEAGTSRKKRKGLVDKVAAQIILQGYLDSQVQTPESFD